MAEKILEIPDSFVSESSKTIDRNILVNILRELQNKLKDKATEDN